ncbi:MAG: bacterial transcriptional activator domain-containing protein, partial [Anaerolineae bacterium]|nr:bacterial transcriptional activator domain-containing protein [Anaerolineae bacterium]
MTLTLQVLGDFGLRRDGELLASGLSHLPRLLLAYLLCHRDAPQPREHVAAVLWPDAPESRTRPRLRKLLFDLRQSLPRADDCIESTSSTLWWRPEAPIVVDLIQFEEALRHAERSATKDEPEAESAALSGIDEVYRGELLPGFYEDWVVEAREVLARRFMRALTRRQRLLEEAGDDQGALAVAERVLQEDPLYEPAYRDLMR